MGLVLTPGSFGIIATLLFLCTATAAHPPQAEFADWFRSLKEPGTGAGFSGPNSTRAAIRDWVANSVPGNGQYLFPSRFHDQPHISTRQYARIVHRWVERAGLDSSAYGTHSMRRTKAAQIYEKTGNLRAVFRVAAVAVEWDQAHARSPNCGCALLD